MSTLIAFIASPLGSYIATKVGARIVQRHGGTWWGKLLGVLLRKGTPEKTDAESLIEKLSAGPGLNDEQKAALTPEELNLVNHGR